MNQDNYLFPQRLTRRDFLTVSSAALAVPALGGAHEASAQRIGSGKWTYTLDEAWGRLPAGMRYGLGCGVVVDARDNVYVTSRSASPCVAVFSREGKLLETWSKDFGDKLGGYSAEEVSGTAHCLYWSKEGKDEFLYFTENVASGGKDAQGKEKPALGKRVCKTDLNGRVLYTIGNVAKESGTSQKFDWTNPTDVAVSPNGDIYVVDGYGSQRVSRFDKSWRHLKTIGGRADKDAAKGADAPHGTFNTCHGIWVNTLGKEPEVFIADRTNGRIEIYSLDLVYRRTIPDFKAPCCFYQQGGHIFVPELGARVSILDAEGRIVARLGDGSKVPKEEKDKRVEFIAPHALAVDSKGDLYVVEWVPQGRVRKFKHTPQAA
ncbi:MAG: hypothetical protein HZA92_05005 [Verrucomicrobia bacterium]|nr:hypothetical protein [Verrucomicrobiota bacterium]